jgi:hypothetical protein
MGDFRFFERVQKTSRGFRKTSRDFLSEVSPDSYAPISMFPHPTQIPTKYFSCPIKKYPQLFSVVHTEMTLVISQGLFQKTPSYSLGSVQK